MLAVTDSAHGEVQFQVPAGIAGKREIQAQFQEARLPRADEIVDNYEALAPPPVEAPTNPSTMSSAPAATDVFVTA